MTECGHTPPNEQTIAFNKFIRTCPEKGKVAYALLVYKDGTAEDYILFNPIAEFLPNTVHQAVHRLDEHIKSETEHPSGDKYRMEVISA